MTTGNGANASIKGNTISGGATGIYLEDVPAALFGNSVTGASGHQIECAGGAFAGAGFNYLGGNSPASGSNCTDVSDQLGAQISSWTEGAANGDVSISGASGTTAIFQLTDDPYSYGAGMSDLAGFYAVMSTAGDGAVTHAGSGGNQAKMHMAATGCSPMTGDCWETASDGGAARAISARPQDGEGYYARGNVDPTAVTFSGAQTNSPAQNMLLITFAAILAAGATALFVFKRSQLLK